MAWGPKSSQVPTMVRTISTIIRTKVSTISTSQNHQHKHEEQGKHHEHTWTYAAMESVESEQSHPWEYTSPPRTLGAGVRGQEGQGSGVRRVRGSELREDVEIKNVAQI